MYKVIICTEWDMTMHTLELERDPKDDHGEGIIRYIMQSYRPDKVPDGKLDVRVLEISVVES